MRRLLLFSFSFPLLLFLRNLTHSTVPSFVVFFFLKAKFPLFSSYKASLFFFIQLTFTRSFSMQGPGKAKLVFYRDDGFLAKFLCHVLLKKGNDYETLASVGFGEIKEVDVEPGAIQLLAEMGGVKKGLKPDLEAEAGKTYYFRLVARFGWPGFNFRLTPVAKEALDRSGLIRHEPKEDQPVPPVGEGDGVLVLFFEYGKMYDALQLQIDINGQKIGVLHNHEIWQIPLAPGRYQLQTHHFSLTGAPSKKLESLEVAIPEKSHKAYKVVLKSNHATLEECDEASLTAQMHRQPSTMYYYHGKK